VRLACIDEIPLRQVTNLAVIKIRICLHYGHKVYDIHLASDRIFPTRYIKVRVRLQNNNMNNNKRLNINDKDLGIIVLACARCRFFRWIHELIRGEFARDAILNFMIGKLQFFYTHMHALCKSYKYARKSSKLS
jgi:hypothetical protein